MAHRDIELRHSRGQVDDLLVLYVPPLIECLATSDGEVTENSVHIIVIILIIAIPVLDEYFFCPLRIPCMLYLPKSHQIVSLRANLVNSIAYSADEFIETLYVVVKG